MNGALLMECMQYGGHWTRGRAQRCSTYGSYSLITQPVTPFTEGQVVLLLKGAGCHARFLYLLDKFIVELADKLLSAEGGAALAGLGARDVLRLEAGLCLYGKRRPHPLRRG